MDVQIKENKMGVLPTGKLLFSMAIPMMISMLVQALYNIVDSIFVSQISEDALTAVSLAFPLQTLMIAFGVGSSVGVNTLLSRSLGAKDKETANKAANTGIFIALCTYMVFALIGAFLSRPFYEAQTDNEAIIEMSVSYTVICLCGSFGLFAQLCFEKLLQSTAKTGLSMVTQIVGAVTNIILDPVFIFGWFGLPAMGVAGAAIATVIGQIVGAAVGLTFNLRCNKEIKLRIRDIKFEGHIVKEVFRIGLPSIIMQSIGSVMTFGMNIILMDITSTASAVFGSYFKLQSFVFMPVFGLNNAMAPIVSYNYGARKSDRVMGAIKLSMVSAIAMMAVGLAVFELFPSLLLSMFSPSENMLLIGRVALRIIATHFMLAGFNIIASSVFQVIGNPFISMIISVSRQLVILLPAAYILSLSGNIDLVWLAFPIAEVVAFVLCAAFLRKTVLNAKDIMKQNQYADELQAV